MDNQMSLDLNAPRRRAVLITDDSAAPEKEQGTKPELTAWFSLRESKPPCSGLWDVRDPVFGDVARFSYNKMDDVWMVNGTMLQSKYMTSFEWRGLAEPPAPEVRRRHVLLV